MVGMMYPLLVGVCTAWECVLETTLLCQRIDAYTDGESTALLPCGWKLLLPVLLVLLLLLLVPLLLALDLGLIVFVSRCRASGRAWERAVRLLAAGGTGGARPDHAGHRDLLEAVVQDALRRRAQPHRSIGS